jgi:hypothetical protein
MRGEGRWEGRYVGLHGGVMGMKKWLSVGEGVREDK